MIEFLTLNIEWWHWIAVGILFIIIELGTGTFFILGFGIAAIIVGIIELLINMSFVMQLLLWIILSIVVIAILFKYFKDQPTVSNSGQSDYGLDTLGTVTKAINIQDRGEVKFDRSILGNSLWKATSDETIAIGARVKIEEVNGQLVKVASA
ncbi:Putative activity regulator of membrane protease YbbK [hydrothermal vent metagenome]|uniref:Putative activity regulator of membrane protease YbbK n=1 Tax=hydrothermal vent metagenome TaxID=652676 RepID=A0A1W1EFJ9_9ZZZZ